MKQKSRIYLVGFMGAGKTSTGSKLANALQYDFVDLDEAFEKRAIISIPEYFQRLGEDAFRLKETELLRSLYATECVYATGGGTPCFHGNMDWMNAHGLTIYFLQSPQRLLGRLRQSKSERPLIRDLNDDELRDYIEKTLVARSGFYEKADVIFNPEDGMESLMDRIQQEQDRR